MPRLSVIVIVKNEEARLARCLRSVSFADEIVVVDNGSTDGTVEIARGLGARVIESPDWPGFGKQKNLALAAATGDWVLSLDADEWVEPPLAAEIQSTIASTDAFNGYEIPRRSRFCGTVVRFSGWSPDYVLRLWRRGRGEFLNVPIHERVVLQGAAGRLSEPIEHDAISSLQDAKNKASRYAAVAAEGLLQEGKRSGRVKAMLRGRAAFLRAFLLRLGFLDGAVGLRIARYNADYTYQKWIRVAEANAAARMENGSTVPAAVSGNSRCLFDCFLFYNELDLLEIRLNELTNVADKFVLAEATTTFTGKPKPLFFSENKGRFAAFGDRIIHVVIDDQPNANPTAWERQIYQRNCLIRGIGEAAPDDLILLSDVDEIPRADAVRAACANPPGKHEVICFELRMYNYFVNLECEDRWLRNGPRLIQRQYLNGFENLRRVKGPVEQPLRDFVRGLDAWKKMGRWVRRTTVPDSGWHFTYTGGIEAIQKKINSYSGHDKVSDEIRDPVRLVQRISDGYSADTRHNTRIEFRPLDTTFPHHLLQHRGRFSELILESPEDLKQKLGALR